MLVGKIKPGSGAGDQIFSYICTRVAALDRGYDFGFVGIEHFKCKSFMSLDWGKPVDLKYKIIPESGDLILEDESQTFIVNTPYFNPEIRFVKDGTIIDGFGAQAEQYFEHRLDEVREWLKTNKVPKTLEDDFNDDVCVINYRGGEYKYVPELYLPKEYWIEAMKMKVKENPNILFQCHTDDPNEARKVFGDNAAIFKDIEQNWLAVRYAKHLIISNSAFAIIPRLLAHLDNPKAVTIAPRYWAGRNVGEWRRPGNYYSKFQYI